jgi:hypothetical protein
MIPTPASIRSRPSVSSKTAATKYPRKVDQATAKKPGRSGGAGGASTDGVTAVGLV